MMTVRRERASSCMACFTVEGRGSTGAAGSVIKPGSVPRQGCRNLQAELQQRWEMKRSEGRESLAELQHSPSSNLSAVMSYQQIMMINDGCVPLSVIKPYESGLGCCNRMKTKIISCVGLWRPLVVKGRICSTSILIGRYLHMSAIDSQRLCTWSARSEMLRGSSTMAL